MLELRDDRELVRMRLDVGEKITVLKTQIKSLLKRYHLRRPQDIGKGWTKTFRAWLSRDWPSRPMHSKAPWATGGRAALASLLRQLQFFGSRSKSDLDGQWCQAGLVTPL